MSGSLSEVETLVEQQEDAIREHGEDAWSVFTKFRDAYVNSVGDEEPTDETRLTKRYLMSSSFIGAHYVLENDKENRDKIAQSCALLLSSFGHSPDALLEEHIRNEQLWIKVFASERIGPAAKSGCMGLIMIFVLPIAGFVYSFV